MPWLECHWICSTASSLHCVVSKVGVNILCTTCCYQYTHIYLYLYIYIYISIYLYIYIYLSIYIYICYICCFKFRALKRLKGDGLLLIKHLVCAMTVTKDALYKTTVWNNESNTGGDWTNVQGDLSVCRTMCAALICSADLLVKKAFDEFSHRVAYTLLLQKTRT